MLAQGEVWKDKAARLVSACRNYKFGLYIGRHTCTDTVAECCPPGLRSRAPRPFLVLLQFSSLAAQLLRFEIPVVFKALLGGIKFWWTVGWEAF